MSTVSLITVTYNSASSIHKCLRAVANQTYKDFEMFIVDNNSQDATIDVIKAHRSTLAFALDTLYLECNTGFAAGNNLALQHVSGNYIALLNPDAFPEPTWLEKLVREMDRNPKVGICASKLLDDGRGLIDSAGDGLSTYFKGFKRGEGCPVSLYDKTEFVFGACAGAALYRRDMLEQIGFFDEDFFLVHEDTDINFRANLAGWKALYVADAVVYHKVHSSIGKRSDIHVYYSLRNAEFVRIKNVPLKLLLKHAPVVILAIIMEFYYSCIKHRKLRIYVKAKIDALRYLSQMYRKRKMIMATKSLDEKSLANVLTPFFTRDIFVSKARQVLFD